MKSMLHLKFIALYIIFGFLCLFTTATLTTQLVENRLMEDTSETLYREATLIASDYLPSYFTDDSSLYAVQSQLAAMRLYLDASLWFVDSTGTMITSSNIENTSAPEAIEEFNPAEIGGSQYISGTYHGYFKEDVITVMAPVTQSFYTKGYLLIHSPVASVEQRCASIMHPVYISLGVIYLLSFIFLLGVHFIVYRPVKKISEAAQQYALGNLDYEIPVATHDEVGYLSASLNYMAAQLKDMDDYQINNGYKQQKRQNYGYVIRKLSNSCLFHKCLNAVCHRSKQHRKSNERYAERYKICGTRIIRVIDKNCHSYSEPEFRTVFHYKPPLRKGLFIFPGPFQNVHHARAR